MNRRYKGVWYDDLCAACQLEVSNPYAFIRRPKGGWDGFCKGCTMAIMDMAVQAGKLAEMVGGAFEVTGAGIVRINADAPESPN